jgi:hypothetical protein
MPDDMRDLWQRQDVDGVTFTLEEIRRKAGRFEQRIRWRNLREYVVGALLMAFFAWGAWKRPGRQRVAEILLIAGLGFVLFQLHRRGSPRAPRAGDRLRSAIAAYREELRRQRDALSSVWLWYELPLVPGVALLFWDTGVRQGINWRYLAGLAYAAAAFVGIWALNRRAARRLDRQIRELEGMEEEDD